MRSVNFSLAPVGGVCSGVVGFRESSVEYLASVVEYRLSSVDFEDWWCDVCTVEWEVMGWSVGSVV